ncbi:MAG TPA: FAD-dependent oxidoreductase [Terriglobia bacterium]|nr:FAD-dependent oxidoreductase [Terriglobia bacterium]
MLGDSTPSPDVLVIGGGVIGCGIALRLAQARLRVAVIERGEPGGEASSAAAGMIAPQGEATGFDAFFDLCQASRDLYPGFVAEVEDLAGFARGGIGYHREGALLLAADENQQAELDKIYRAQASHGLPIERLAPEEVHRRARGLSPHITGGLFVPGDHWVDNERLASALAVAGQRAGVTFHTHTAVSRLIERGDRPGTIEGAEISASGGADDNPAAPGSILSTGVSASVSAGCFILAAGCWSSELAASVGVDLPMQPCRGQMIEFEADGADRRLPLVVRAGHHYMVPHATRILAGTTAEYVGFEKAVTGEGLRSILEGVGRIAPLVGGLRFRRAWAGLRPDMADHRPVLGYGSVSNLVFATGHFRNGILLAPITAKLISELVLTGSSSVSLDRYGPGRFAPVSTL